MLKVLELIGFKSFADKTRFEFPKGITVVVGPNGSGKSNVVDAIKWVLGEQSVKSLRGKEMADVIFNGSGARRGLNSAEATLTFDNATRMLPLDTADVHITRRVFRNGEGEYLINRQPCRLRDIRDLFAGTGVATEAYSVIEQGKVDVLLQSSPRDRRLIFEEAAGISRFKAKKIEAQRRLERVEQNLLRLSDIVDEVENRLKGVRLQAAKARRYREYSERLQLLRTQVGRVDWQALGEQLAAVEAETDAARRDVATTTAAAEAGELKVLELENRIAAVDLEIRTREARIGKNRERVTLLESTIEHERQRCRELEEQISRGRRQMAALTSRAGDTGQQQHDALTTARAAEERQRAMRASLADQERALTELTGELDRLRNESQQRRAAHVEQMRKLATLGHEISRLETQLAAAQDALQRCGGRAGEVETARQAIQAEIDALQSRQLALVQACEACQAETQAVQTRLASLRQQSAAQQRQLAQWRQRHSGALERGAVLEELEKRQEGISAGVKQALAQAAGPAPGPLDRVRGMLADLLNVTVEYASIVDAVLGERAQHLVVAADNGWLGRLAAALPSLAGRASFLRLTPRNVAEDRAAADLTAEAGVMARLDRCVTVADEYASLVESLLGHTWLVADLPTAARLAASGDGNQQFVTPAGEVLAADGTLTLGPRQASTGLVSRRSELRAVRQQIAELDEKIKQADELAAALDDAIAAQAEQLDQAAAAQQRADAALHEHQLGQRAVEERGAQLQRQAAALDDEGRAAQVEFERAGAALNETRLRLTSAEAGVSEAEARIHENAGRIDSLDRDRGRRQRETTTGKVELARLEQQLDALQTQLRRHEQDQQERQRAIGDAREQLNQYLERARQSEAAILSAESEIAQLYIRKESFSADTVAAINRREELRAERGGIAQEVQRLRGRIRKQEEKLHKKELAAGDLQHQRAALTARLQEDYGIDLAALEQAPTPEEQLERGAVETEIADLRQKIGSIGGVNLDALKEADELEARFASLSAQFTDLSSAKASLDQIIGKINADSRRLFGETLEVVKGHFQGLFRKLFGGGQADIVLEEGVDILDCGIEIVARPPGKEPRNISLLSGGEKTLTCVALLLAVFRSRPSPFCVLDEVDAALDEANIQRFIGVLTEFLAWTQFVVVTHSKKTMTCANTLYGVTMQESGVSKRVSVRFEDVTETGEILRTRDDEPSADEAA